MHEITIAKKGGITITHNLSIKLTSAAHGKVIKHKSESGLNNLSDIFVFLLSIKKLSALVTHMHNPVPQNSALIPQMIGKNHIAKNITIAPMK